MKKLMRNLLVMIIAAVFVLSLVGCGNGSEAEAADYPEDEVIEVQEEEVQEEEAEEDVAVEEEVEEVDEEDTEEDAIEEPEESGVYQGVEGTWAWLGDENYLYVFDVDGSGMRGFPLAPEFFTWTSFEETGDLYLDFPSIVEEWSMLIDGEFILFSSRQVADLHFVYECITMEHLAGNLLPGLWTWDVTDEYAIAFLVGGLGTRGTDDDVEIFSWTIDEINGILFIETDLMVEEWDLFMAEDGLSFTIASRQVEEMVYTYYFEGDLQPLAAELLGSWAAYADGMFFEYLFHADGSGVRGDGAFYVEFFWELDEDTGAIDFYFPGRSESWSYTVEGDILTINSREVAGLSFSYRLIAD